MGSSPISCTLAIANPRVNWLEHIESRPRRFSLVLPARSLALGRSRLWRRNHADRVSSKAHRSASPADAVHLNHVVARRQQARVKPYRQLLARRRLHLPLPELSSVRRHHRHLISVKASWTFSFEGQEDPLRDWRKAQR